MTGRTLPTPMIGRLVTAMACFAVSGSHCLVVEIGLRPIRRIVTG